MNKDNVYVFNKKTYEATILGEIQQDFNSSFVIDGTKDSCSILVYSYSDVEIEPQTLLFHLKTQTWWIVSHDKVERYQNDNGFMYVHNLDLLGAIEMLNARDLTDSGFNTKKYTVGQFITRLFNHSNFEKFYLSGFEMFNIVSNSLSLDKQVDFVKTFENYTLLSALREFLDAYNCAAKLSFDYNVDLQGNLTLRGPILTIISKTGDITIGEYDIDDFDDIRQTTTMDKNSYGSCVVSNAENVISSNEKTFPTTGAVKCVAHEYNVKAQNAIIKLPSKVFKGNWIKMTTTQAFVEFVDNVGQFSSHLYKNQLHINPYNKKSFDDALDLMLERVRINDESYYTNNDGEVGDFYNPCREALLAAKEGILEQIKKLSSVTIYNGNELNPVTGEIIQGKNVPELTHLDFRSKNQSGKAYIFCDKEMKNNLPTTWQGIAWERGSDEITGFDGFEPITGMSATVVVRNLKYTDLNDDVSLNSYGEQNENPTYEFFRFETSVGSAVIRLQKTGDYRIHFRDNAQWIVNYVPMSDIKIKVDNALDKRDIQLYNQNGKLTDNVALSKLINSYSKEISSDTITKFMEYRNFNDVPKVGSIVHKGTDRYVINNVSITCSQNESTNDDNFAYFIEAEITMSKYYAVKSLMVNPQTNIRDYGIPQNFNVKRKQLYRDYYELNYSVNDDNETDIYFPTSRIFDFGHEPNSYTNLVCLIRTEYSSQVEGSLYWYYQLETTKYTFNKMIYIITDFNDNNIIGYGSQNVYSGFVISRVFSGLTDVLNTPISYVDSNGEVKGFRLIYLDNEQLTNVYTVYEDEESGESGHSSFVSKGGSLYNYSVFIPQRVYDLAIYYSQYDYSMQIHEDSYQKDALEVPVFEYACQVEDTTEVLIGDNFFNSYGDYFVNYYSIVQGTNLTQDNVEQPNSIREELGTTRYTLNSGAKITFSNSGNENTLVIRWLESLTCAFASNGTKTWTESLPIRIIQGYDYAVFRHSFDVSTGREIKDLLFIAKNVPSSSISTGDLIIKINHYKLN